MKNILITGANRGLGKQTALHLAKQNHQVILTARDPKKGKAAVDALNKETGKTSVHFLQLDLDQESDFAKAVQFVQHQFGHLDVLINNAGIICDGTDTTSVKKEDLAKLLETNFYAPLLLSQQLIPLLEKSEEGRIINVSSSMGALAKGVTGYAAYRMSKAALNGLTNFMANDLFRKKIKVVSVDPGWVKTDMGGVSANRSLDEGVAGIVWLATAPEIITGSFYRDGEVIGW